MTVSVVDGRLQLVLTELKHCCPPLRWAMGAEIDRTKSCVSSIVFIITGRADADGALENERLR